MADETASTASSEQTTTETAATEGAATAATETAAETAATETKGDDLGTTALGGAGEEADDKTEGSETEGAASEVPETYELVAPEGFEKLDEAAVAAATPVFKELGLSNEQANKLIPVVGDYAKRIIADRDQQFLGTILEQRKSWLEEARADKEIGGANWDASLQESGRAMDRLGFPKGSPLRTALDDSGFGNHPEMVRFFARVGKAIGEDTDFVRSDHSAAVKRSPEEILYPNDIPQQGAK